MNKSICFILVIVFALVATCVAQAEFEAATNNGELLPNVTFHDGVHYLVNKVNDEYGTLTALGGGNMEARAKCKYPGKCAGCLNACINIFGWDYYCCDGQNCCCFKKGGACGRNPDCANTNGCNV